MNSNEPKIRTKNMSCKCCGGVVQYTRQSGYWSHSCPHTDCNCDKKEE
jgi:hypothetical protein